ncbi:MAG: GUN4 domain-containing protein [Microcoleus vaginatus WJT46-NPBG5]|jgi:tetratricopeptide (TPR) repeat protein|nr:GUN4 domain-containing protein [Microcoleus vaginatus WJT46-NPBG5]
MTTEQPNLQQLAKQGNPKAIASLLNRSLQPKGITAKAAVKNGCLQLMLEAEKVPPKQPYVDSLRKGLTNLMPTAIQKVKVYGKQVDEDVPEWLEEFNLSVQPIQDLSELARQGDVKAINTLLNQSLQPHGVVAKAKLKTDCLQVMLESAEIPNQRTMVDLLNAEVLKLRILSVNTMKIFGKQTDEDFPDWHQEISLELKSEIPLQQVGLFNTSVSDNEEFVQSVNLASSPKVDVIRLSNQIYETLKTAFSEPLLKRVEDEEEKDIHEAANFFIDNLEQEFKLVIEKIPKSLIILSKSFGVTLDLTKTTFLFSGISTSYFSKVSSAIKQLRLHTTEVLNYHFFQEEEDSLFNWDVVKSAGAGFLLGGGLFGAVTNAYVTTQAKSKEQEEKQLILEKYRKSREKLIQEWTELFKINYEAVCSLVLDSYSLKLTNYHSLNQAEELCEKAFEYIEAQKLKEAIAACDRAIELNPILVPALNLRGSALYGLECYEVAIKDFDKAVEIDEKHIFSWENKGDCLQSLERYEEAIVAYDKAISLDDNYYSVWLSKSLSLYKLKRYSEAIKTVETAIAIEAEDYESWYVKAACAAAMQNTDQVLESLQKAFNFNLEECREKVKNNFYFDFIRNDEKFKALTQESSVGVDYSELKKLLADKEWKKADQETARIMCSAAQLAFWALFENEEETFVVPDQVLTELDEMMISKFPCDDLNTIDKLWLEHSNGKFGFSIQREIYKSLGGTQVFNGEIRDKFGNQTGWRVRDKNDNYSWRRSDLFEYDFEKAPKGHLPSCLWAAKEDGWFLNRRDRLIALFARIDACLLSNLPKQ